MATHRFRNTEIESSSTGLLVLLDTSFLLACLKQRLDFEFALQNLLQRRLKIAVIDMVVNELQHLARAGRWNSSHLARIALDIISGGAIEIIETPLTVSDTDTSLLAFALGAKSEIAVATVDSNLKGLLKLNGVTVISPRSRSGLTVTLGNRFRLL